MSAGKNKIRFPKSVTLATTLLSGVRNVEWDPANEYNRDPGDEQFSGDPVETSRKGSGSFDLMAGAVPACYGQGMVVVHNEVSVDDASGTETITTKTTTFTKVTINKGYKVPAGNVGGISVKFDFAEATTV